MENCNYWALKDDMIRDCIVVGMRDTTLSKRLQFDLDLNLEKAKKAARKREAVYKQNQSLTTSPPSNNIAKVQPKKSQRQCKGASQSRMTLWNTRK